MSLFSDIKFFLKKYLKNPALVVAGAYLIYKFINDKKRKENFVEAVHVLEDDEQKVYSKLFDSKMNKYILLYLNDVYTADKESEIDLKIKQLEAQS